MENYKISLGQSGGKKVDFASFLPTKQQKEKKKQKMPYPQLQKSHKLWFEIIQWYSKFPYKFKEIISFIIPYV